MAGDLKIKLVNYPAIEQYLNETGNVQMVANFLAILDSALRRGHHEVSEKQFGIPLDEVIRQTYDAHFDYKGITQNAGSVSEAELLAILEYENNPLKYVTGGEMPKDTEGNPISIKDYLGTNKVELKKFIQKMLYSAKYLNHVDYVNYMMLGRHDLMQIERNEHIEELLEVQPALLFQKRQGLPIGYFMEGTGFFDCGEMDLRKLDLCPACALGAQWKKINDIGYCFSCKAAVKHVVLS